MRALRVAVCSLDPPDHACSQLRVVQPLVRARPAVELIWATHAADGHLQVEADALRGADLVLVTRFFPQPPTAEFLDQLFESGTPVVYELDDLITEVPESNPYHARAESYRAVVLECLRRVTAVTVSTRELASAVSIHNPNVYALPNAIEPALFRAPVRARGDVFTVAYLGTPTHELDLRSIESALLRVVERYGDRVRLLLAGCATDRLAALPQTCVVEFEADYVKYAAMLRQAEIHLALAPLTPTPFNLCKSSVKWLEYSAAGVPGVYADLEPYRGVVEDGRNGRLVGPDPESWYDAMCELIESEPTRQSMAHAAQTEVMREHAVERAASAWVETYRHVVTRGGIDLHPRPLCSIVIPVYNRAELTQQCLDALVALRERTPFELIVVDNASTDGTAELLRTHPSAPSVLRNATNLGFARACNQGARAARGEWLVFLNNDTLPLPGWLDALLEAAFEVEGVGIVGSRLLYPNRAVQHAGVALCVVHGGPYHLYGGFLANSPRVMRRREVLAVTGACMLVREELFRKLSGFDETYRNGFEDVDFCLRAALADARLLYEPRSLLYHLESQTEGRKERDLENLSLFRQRWGAARFADESRFYFADGIAKHLAPKGMLVMMMEDDLDDPAERQRWARVAHLQTRLAREGALRMRSWIGEPEDWPADPQTLEWAARLCREAGLQELGYRFATRAGSWRPGETRVDPLVWIPKAVRAQLSLA